MPSFLDYSDFCENLKEVTSTKILDKKKFDENGLFSEQIFGPIQNYTCQCGTYYGVSNSGGTCNICGVDIVNSRVRRERFGKIRIPISVVNPLFYDMVVYLEGTNFKKYLDTLMKDETSILCRKGEEYVLVHNYEDTRNVDQYWEKLDAIYELVRKFAEDGMNDGSEEWTLIYNNLDKLLINDIIVLPPELRPTSKKANINEVDEINRYYMQILMKKSVIEGTMIDSFRDKKVFYQYFKQLQNNVNELYKQILAKLSKKEGLIRGNILGKRIDFSGRAVISPDPTLEMNECILPYVMFLELFKLDVAKRLIESEKFKLLNNAIDYVDNCVRFEDKSLLPVCEEILENKVCLLNRQPSLHRLSMLGFKIKISTDRVIKLHPLACAGFNADFDGDQMATYIPISTDTKNEVYDKFLMKKNLISPASDKISATPGQDIVLGIYFLTNNKFSNLLEEVEYNGKTITTSQKIFNDCFPDDFDVIDYPVRKGKLIDILDYAKEVYDEDTMCKILDNVKKVGFKYSTLYGTSMALNYCEVPGTEELKNQIYSGDITEQLQKVSDDEILDQVKDNFEYSYMVESGARGKWDQVKQVVLTRGFISNFHGKIQETPIKNSLLDGLTQEEFFNSTFGSRKGLLDTAINTGNSGYLSRKLVMAMINLQLDDETEDCGTSDLYDIYVSDENQAELLLHRYYKESNDKSEELKLITRDNFKQIVGKVIFIRSPIFCRNEKICKTCYGRLYERIRSRFIGVISAQSLGEINTQLILRSFHTSGVANVGNQSKEEMLQQDIVSDLSTISKSLHTGIKDHDYRSLTNVLSEIYNRNGKVHHVHFECLVSQLMWYNHTKWRLLNDRDKVSPEYHSVQTIPTLESWLLGLAFSAPKKHILKGILYSGKYKGIIDNILCGEKIS